MKLRYSLLLIMVSFVQFTVAATFPGYEYIHPKPNSSRVSPEATIILRFSTLSPLMVKNLASCIDITDTNGPVAGSTRIASDNRTIIFTPDEPFPLGERVYVKIHPDIDQTMDHLDSVIEYFFDITKSPAIQSGFIPEDERTNEMTIPTLQKSAADTPRIMPNGVSVPSDFPHINVTTNSEPSDGYIFLNNRGRGTPYNIIFDNDGSPVWYLRTDDRRRDFKIQLNGTITMLGRSGGHRFINFDNNFNHLRDYSAVDGYSTDEHECRITEDGHVLLLGRREETVDMSVYVDGGRKNATVRETVIQEFTPEGDKIFEWRAWDHFEDVLKDLQVENLTGGYIRFPHMNAIDIDDDGNIILSSRHLSEVTKINRQTGEIIWRLGGPKNQFTFVNDDLNGNYNQHAVLALGNNHYTMFDNGTSRNPSVSRGVEYEIDAENKTATLVWEYRNPDGTEYSHYMGNCQRLPSGNSLINWAISNRPKATEVTPDGQVVYEMNWEMKDECYRAFRFPWNGQVEKPALYVDQLLNDVTLIFNKFGDADVQYYNIYADTSPNAIVLVDTSKMTLKALTNLEHNQQYYVRVAAVYADGSVSAFSNEERVLIQTVERGVNFVANGDFSQRKADWIFELQGAGDAEWEVNDGVAHFKITDGGSQHYSVQLRQNGMPLATGETYRFEFDAWADAPKTIEAKVGQDGGSYINYSGIGLSVLSRAKKHFVYEFTMTYPGDPNGRVVFNVGETNDDVYLENISLKIPSTVEVAKNDDVKPEGYVLGKNYPNPFNSNTTIQFDVPSESRVKVDVFDVLGRLQMNVVDTQFAVGHHSVHVDASSLSSGVYIYRMTALDNNGGFRFSNTQEMLLVK